MQKIGTRWDSNPCLSQSNSAIINKVKQGIHLLKEKLIDAAGSNKGKCLLLNLHQVETAENGKLLKKLDRDLLQLNASFTANSRKSITLNNDKNFVLIMLQLRGKIAVLWDGPTQIEFDILNVYSYTEILSTSTINIDKSHQI